MRLFFGLELEPSVKLTIDKWREINLPPLEGTVPVANFHITLAFLGAVPVQQHETLLELAQQVSHPAFSITLDQMGYWPKPKTLWIGPSHIPPALRDLASSLSAKASRLGLPKDSRPYVPHISLYRKQASNPPVCLMQPDISIDFEHFCLFESRSGRSGVQYQVLERWPLNTGLSVREKLARGRLDH
ncbi:RNA 2',3'-cyclic phosphodiesterase [Lacimicrobium alkaliphilum]|uniref:RNA 2',3'-cyclic phosphodiesterase n=1 Tax=Lacimicrobium alkaliphilum TaxID=1526571 RepID=A0ABQ1R0H8_9ALTE|nr:RNA 2',3'-cyclic phosphodiesterase [Lacimicrobium alkaliphilum]GGD50858.1 RNA 2',3'-cyclic phosphodiesterase [Lacimicrobium alkaliphilum]